MDPLIQLLPLLVLIALAVFLIRRGSLNKPDRDKNKSNIGGGPGDGGGID